MKHKQQGMSLIGFIMILVVAGVFAFLAMRVAPMFLDFNTMRTGVDKVAANATSPSVVELRKAMDRQMQIDYAYGYKPEFISVETVGGQRVLQLKYEDRRALAYNLEIVGKFEHTAPLPQR